MDLTGTLVTNLRPFYSSYPPLYFNILEFGTLSPYPLSCGSPFYLQTYCFLYRSGIVALSANATASRVVALAIAAQFSAAAPASLHKKAGNWIWKSRVSPDSNVERVLVTGGEPFYYSRQYPRTPARTSFFTLSFPTSRRFSISVSFPYIPFNDNQLLRSLLCGGDNISQAIAGDLSPMCRIIYFGGR